MKLNWFEKLMVNSSIRQIFLRKDARFMLQLGGNLIKGEMAVIPKGIEHKPSCREECKILLIEPAGTLNTGDAGGDLTETDLEWI